LGQYLDHRPRARDPEALREVDAQLVQQRERGLVLDGDVAELLLAPTPGQPAALEVTLGETTGAVNSAANIIPDSPGSPENEAEDFSVGTATPLRLRAGGMNIAQPFSVQSSAPADAGGSNALVDIMEDAITLRVTRAETQSQAAEGSRLD